jgi:hypothetical protein
MIDIPEIRKKPVKAPYRKPEAVRELERLADDQARRKYPNMKPEHLAPRKFRDDSANSLTGCIVQYVTLKGGFASRINSTGVFRQKLGKYTSGTQKRGIADVLATFKGLSLHIEVKHGKDSQSEAQKKIESEVKRSGGFYYLARNFSDFKIWFDNL